MQTLLSHSPLQAATRDFVCDCGDRHGTPTHQPADHAEERKESDMADDDADGIDLYECHGMMSSTERVYQLIHPMPKFISQWVRQQNEMQKAKEAAAAETPAAAPKAASKSAKAATKAATKTASKGAPAWMPKPKSTSKPSSKSILKAETAAAADPAAADAKKQD
jgi:hypothetical protein